jgi:hypothetical protein
VQGKLRQRGVDRADGAVEVIGEDERKVFGAALGRAQLFLALPPERDDQQQREDEKHPGEQAAHRCAQPVGPRRGRIGLDFATSHARLWQPAPNRQCTLCGYV